jgi:diguanylate cyclase (GGDEF)-like protein
MRDNRQHIVYAPRPREDRTGKERIMSNSDEGVPAGLSTPHFQQALLDAINNASPEGILVVNGDGLIVSYNQRILDVWGIPPEVIADIGIGSAIGAVNDPLLASVCERTTDPAAFAARLRELHYSPDLDDDCEVELKDGRTLARVSTALYGRAREYLGRVWFYRDITAQKTLQAQLEALAREDSLTGVMNRRYYDERAAQEFARAEREHRTLAIVEFDLDHFKQINDRHGHAAGDEVLRAVAIAGRSMIRTTSLFARVGGEEFVVLLSPATQEGALLFAERLRELVASLSIPVGGQVIHVTISVGVALRHPGGDTPTACQVRADNAMYEAKTGGRNRVALAR